MRVSEGTSPHKSVRCGAYPTQASFGPGDVVGQTWSTFCSGWLAGGFQRVTRGPRYNPELSLSVQRARDEVMQPPSSVTLRRAALGVRITAGGEAAE